MVVGIADIVQNFTQPDLSGAFEFSDLQCWSLGQGQGFVAELHGLANYVKTGTSFDQDYILRFAVSRRAKLAWLREYWTPARHRPSDKTTKSDPSYFDLK